MSLPCAPRSALEFGSGGGMGRKGRQGRQGRKTPNSRPFLPGTVSIEKINCGRHRKYGLIIRKTDVFPGETTLSSVFSVSSVVTFFFVAHIVNPITIIMDRNLVLAAPVIGLNGKLPLLGGLKNPNRLPQKPPTIWANYDKAYQIDGNKKRAKHGKRTDRKNQARKISRGLREDVYPNNFSKRQPGPQSDKPNNKTEINRNSIMRLSSFFPETPGASLTKNSL
jgi:hypothetical protein